MIKIYLFILIFIFLSSCGGDKEIIQNKEQINLFEKNKIINSELNTSLKINLSKFVNNSFLNNNTNNNGNIIFDTEFDKKKNLSLKKSMDIVFSILSLFLLKMVILFFLTEMGQYLKLMTR